MARYALWVVAFLVAVSVLTFASVRFGLGRLPGDIIVDRGGVVLYLPITSSILVSLLLSLLLWLFNR